MSKPVTGEWYEFCDVRVCCVAVSKQNDVVFEYRNGSFEFFRDGEEPLDDLKYLPDCTGWDWQPETFPQYYDHGLKGDRRNGTAFIRRDSVEKYACVSVDGCDKTKYDWNESCKYYVRCGTWKQITEQQALALLDKPQPAEDPEEWVVQDRVPARLGIDERRYVDKEGNHCVWGDASLIACWNGPLIHGSEYKGLTLELRCRRKDLPKQCGGCGKPLLPENAWMEDGCPCNSPKGVNAPAARRVTVPKWLVIYEGEIDVYEQTSKPASLGAEVHRVGETTYEID